MLKANGFCGVFLNFIWAELWPQLHRYKPGEILLLLWSQSWFSPAKAAAETGSETPSGTFQLPTAAVYCCVLSFTMRTMSPLRAEGSPSCLTPNGTQAACQLWVTIHFAESIRLAGLPQQGNCREEGQGWQCWWEPLIDVRGPIAGGESREFQRCEPARWIWLQHRLSCIADSHSAVVVDLLVQTSTTVYTRFPVCVTSPQFLPGADEYVSHPSAGL